MKSSFLGNDCDTARPWGWSVPGLHSQCTGLAVDRGGAVAGGRGEGCGEVAGMEQREEVERRDGE